MAADLDPRDHAAQSNELERLRADHDRLLRIIEEQSATAKVLAGKPTQNPTVWWFLMSLSLLLILVLMWVAWFYFYPLEPVSEGTDSGTCAQWSSEESLRPERIAGGVGPVVLTYAPFLT